MREHPLGEGLVGARGAQVDVEDVHGRLRVALEHQARLLQRGEAADARAVAEVEPVARAGALDEGDAAHRLAVAGPDDPALGGAALRGHPLHHHVGDDVGLVAEGEVGDRPGVVRPPAGGDDHRADLQLDGLRPACAGRWRRTCRRRRTSRTRRRGRWSRRSRTAPGAILEREVGGLRRAHPVVEGAGPVDRADLGAGVAHRAAVGDVARLDPHRRGVAAGSAGDRLHLGGGEHPHRAVVAQPLVVDLQPAARRAELGEVAGELRHPAAEVGVALDQVHGHPRLGGLEGGGDPGDPAAHHQDGVLPGLRDGCHGTSVWQGCVDISHSPLAASCGS